MHQIKFSRLGFVLGAALLTVLTGCVGYVEGPRAHVYAPPPSPVYAQTEVMADDYVYYPSYQVYYTPNRRQYVYLQGSSWVSRPAPPSVPIDVLFASPSVSLDFHDAPSVHHATVVQSYPKNWTPPGQVKEKHENRGHSQEGR